MRQRSHRLTPLHLMNAAPVQLRGQLALMLPPKLPRDAGASQWTVLDDRYLQLPGDQSVGKTVLNLMRPSEARPLVADRD